MQDIKSIKGRPREYDRDKVEIDMLEWAKKPTSQNMLGFCSDYLIPSPTIIRFKNENESFRLSYDLVRNIIGERREKALSSGNLHVKAYDLNAATYDAFLKEERQDMAKFESSLRTSENDSHPEEVVKKLEMHMNYLKNRQENLKRAKLLSESEAELDNQDA